MTNKCEICKNKEICKYEADYLAMFEKLDRLDANKIFPINLDCKYYESPIKDSDFTKLYRDYWAQSDKTNMTDSRVNCRNCDFYNNYILKGQTYWTGDIPCQWCANSPTRVTCVSTSSSIGNKN